VQGNIILENKVQEEGAELVLTHRWFNVGFQTNHNGFFMLGCYLIHHLKGISQLLLIILCYFVCEASQKAPAYAESFSTTTSLQGSMKAMTNTAYPLKYTY
jgi:hypothetical protein